MRRTFNFPDDVNKHLSKQPNMTQYIVELIRNDMANKKILTEQDVINIIERYLGANVDTKDHQVVNSMMNIIDL